MKGLKRFKDMDKDDLLELVGLQSRQSTADVLFPVLAAFGVGMLVGAGVGMLLAPKPGRELRDDLRMRLSNVADQATSAVASTTGTVERPSPTRSL